MRPAVRCSNQEVHPMFLTALTLTLVAAGQGPSDYREPFPAHKLVGNVYLVKQGKADQGKPTAVPAISDRLRKYVDAKEIAGAVTLVATPDKILHLDATGNAALNPVEAL